MQLTRSERPAEANNAFYLRNAKGNKRLKRLGETYVGKRAGHRDNPSGICRELGCDSFSRPPTHTHTQEEMKLSFLNKLKLKLSFKFDIRRQKVDSCPRFCRYSLFHINIT